MNNTNFDLEFQRETLALAGGAKPRLLLHVCCAPCASVTLDRTLPFFDVSTFFYNPNIYPYAEQEKRAAQLFKLSDALGGFDVLIPPRENDPFAALSPELAAAPEGGARCRECFLLRLGATAKHAAENGYEYFCSSLTVGPMKNSAAINAVGLELEARFGVKWLRSDFKKRGGYARSVELSRQYELFRQNYCGCRFSLHSKENDSCAL